MDTQESVVGTGNRRFTVIECDSRGMGGSTLFVFTEVYNSLQGTPVFSGGPFLVTKSIYNGMGNFAFNIYSSH